MKNLIATLFIAMLATSCSKTNNPTPSSTSTQTPTVTGKFAVASRTYYNGTATNAYNTEGILLNNNINANAGSVYFNGAQVTFSTVGNSYGDNFIAQNYSGPVTWKFDGNAANNVSAFTFTAKACPYVGIASDTIHVNGNGSYTYNGNVMADTITLTLSNTFNAQKTYTRLGTAGNVTFTQADVNAILNDPSNNGHQPTYLYITITAKNAVNYSIGGRTYQFISEQIAQQNIQVRN